MSEFSYALYEKLRPIEGCHSAGWQAENEINDTADDIINTPEKYLLTREELYKAEGGTGGLALQVAVLGLGVGSVFASSARMTHLFRIGSFTWQEWLCVGGTAVSANWLGTWASVNLLGNRQAYHNHWMAYYYVKSCNRWQGRQILKNAPMTY